MRYGRIVRVILAAVAVAAMFAGCGGSSEWDPQSGEALREPAQIYPEEGVAKVELEAVRGKIEVAGSEIEAQPFNGTLIGPTIHVHPGQRIEAIIRNATGEGTNIHYHGLHVSPNGISDNVFRDFDPDGTFTSIVDLPGDHSPGTYWYHVHLHGLTEQQVMGGMSGLIVVEGLEKLLPRELRDIRQRQLAIRDVQAEGDAIVMKDEDISPDKPSTWLVDGQLEPRFELASGETQLWSLANVGADRFYEVGLEGHSFTVLAQDGSPVWRTFKTKRLALPPGRRYDVLVQGGEPGTYSLRSLSLNMGRGKQAVRDLATVEVTGPAAAPYKPLPRTLKTPAKPLDSRRIAKHREFVFTLTDFNGEFKALINGELFNPEISNVAPVLGTVEEWTLVNRSKEDHPFHIHVNDFQVMEVDGEPYHAHGLQDVVVIPRDGGEVVIRVPFEDYPGHFVFHCHILGHEDAGMMQTVDVIRPGDKPSPPPQMAQMGHSHSG
jgi:suppressor of ftsI